MIEKIRSLAGSVTPNSWLLGGALLLAIAGLAVAITSANDILDDTRETAHEAGESGAVAAGQEQTLEQLKDANDAEEELRAAGLRSADRYAGCLRDNRVKSTCERFRPLDQ